jgi:hypothetical protein
MMKKYVLSKMIEGGQPGSGCLKWRIFSRPALHTEFKIREVVFLIMRRKLQPDTRASIHQLYLKADQV